MHAAAQKRAVTDGIDPHTVDFEEGGKGNGRDFPAWSSLAHTSSPLIDAQNFPSQCFGALHGMISSSDHSSSIHYSQNRPPAVVPHCFESVWQLLMLAEIARCFGGGVSAVAARHIFDRHINVNVKLILNAIANDRDPIEIPDSQITLGGGTRTVKSGNG